MKGLTKLLFILSFLLIASALLYLFVQQAGRVSVDKLLIQTDQKIQEGKIAEAKKLLKSSRKMNLSRHNWLRVIDRAYSLSKSTSDYTVLETVAQRAAKTLPGAQEFWAFYTESLLRQKRYAEAKEAAMKIDSEEFSGLRGEALLSDLHSDQANPLEYAEKSLTTSADASYFQSVAQDLKSPVLFYDAAILWLKSGYPERARAILPWIGVDKQTPAIGRAMIAFDSGDVGRAAQELDRIRGKQAASFDEIFLSGSLNLVTGHYRNAYDDYNQALTLNPKGDWRAYQNLAVLSWENNDPKKSIQYLRSGLKVFPLQKVLLLTYCYYLGNAPEVKTLLTQYLAKYPLDPEVNIYNLFYFKGQTPPENQTTTLWILLNNNPLSKTLISYMVWFFLSNLNVVDANLVLERFANAGGPENWITFYKGFVQVAENNFDSALQSFSEPTPNGWEGPYNQGLIYQYMGNYNAAFETFTRAEKAFYGRTNSNKHPRNLSNIYGQLALASLQNQKYALARTVAERAISIDKNNVLAQRVLRETTI